ncbi:hypothetical protein [Actinophytocola sediminis]
MIGRDVTPDWVDRVAIDRALAGRPVGRRLHRAERLVIARRLVAAGHGASMIDKVTRCGGRAAQELAKEARA